MNLSPPASDVVVDRLLPAAEAMSVMELSERVAELAVRLDVAESERRHAREVLESLPQAVMVTDPFAEVVLLSASAARMFGVGPGERAVGPVAELVRDEALTRLIVETCEQHQRGACRRVRRSVMTPSGRRNLDVTLLCVCDQDDGRPSPWGAVVILEETDAVSRQHLAELTAAVAHELRTPLSAVVAYSEMLLDKDAVDETSRREFLRIIASEADRLTRLVDNMQLLARMECGQSAPLREGTDLCEVLRTAAEVILPQARQSGITLTLMLPPEGVDTHLPGDHDLLMQAMLNVLANAVKYTPQSGRVVVRLESGDAVHEVTVTDSGVGVSAADLPFVFDRFYRGSRGRTMASGSGLGLSLVQQIVETVHGGEVQLRSEEGRGTEVRLVLPRGPTRQSTAEADCAGGNPMTSTGFGGPHAG
jgi:signal transduction histidine kinase